MAELMLSAKYLQIYQERPVLVKLIKRVSQEIGGDLKC